MCLAHGTSCAITPMYLPGSCLYLNEYMLIPAYDLPTNLMSSFSLSSLKLNPELKKLPIDDATELIVAPPSICGNLVAPILSPILLAAFIPPTRANSLAVLFPKNPVKKDDACPFMADIAVDVTADVTCPATTFLNTLVAALRSPMDARLAMLMFPAMPDMSMPPMFVGRIPFWNMVFPNLSTPIAFFVRFP